MSQQLIRIAAAQYPIDYFGSEQDFHAKLAAWVAEAAPQAELLLFPEYAALELCSLLPTAVQGDLHRQLEQLQAFLPLFLASHQALARQYRVTLVAGSFPVRLAGGRYVNRAHVIHPDGGIDYQDKQIMTRFEREAWLISPGTDCGVRVIDTAVGKVGISICYDAEFPLIARRQVELGAEILLVPSVTETVAGYYRVRIGSQARALENQCYVVHAPLVGEALWSPAVDVSRGRAGVYTPVDQGFPADGVLVQGEMDQSGWIYASLDMTRMRAVRQSGTVLNYQDWAKQLC
ncbi:MAG TPA: carbon-nitrogen hydrolase family protein [Thiolinea sp.]|nr:carbon-nitrogen hydrolase family protein [Thiolinea sp.]